MQQRAGDDQWQHQGRRKTGDWPERQAADRPGLPVCLALGVGLPRNGGVRGSSRSCSCRRSGLPVAWLDMGHGHGHM